MSRFVFGSLLIGVVSVALLVPLLLDSPMARTQVLPGPDGRGQRAAWPKQVGTVRAVLGPLTAQDIPHSTVLPSLQRSGFTSTGDSLLSPRPGGERLAPITIDYPAEGSIFPPDIAPPRFIWRDAREGAKLWLIEVSFSDGSNKIQVKSQGERLHIGEIDKRCVAETNKLPQLTPQEAASWSWKPDAATWTTIKKHSVERPATVTITGFRDENATQAISQGRGTIETSKDPVGAPIFYRDVPLIPVAGENGEIKPLPEPVLPFVQWRLRSVGDTESRLMMTGLSVCANCHSFSSDGKTMGMDVDGAANEKDLYSLTPIKQETSIRKENVIKWTSFRPLEEKGLRVGFMSRVSPDGRYVVTMISDSGPKQAGSGFRPQNRMYVANFMDYRLLQTFYPTRGLLVWYDRETRKLNLLPGASDPYYVQTGGVWSPDGKYIVFARAVAKDAFPKIPPRYANDPNEVQIQYDLYRVPFNNGKGGVAEAITGASHNGMSNHFAKVSPDGRWIVFAQCRNGMVLRPDSKLYIVPFWGGRARRMRCNLAIMNSWHSFSPNGHWLVFSSKGRSFYTQMFLTHIDEEGNDSPAILIENATVANRAVNLPEFVNVQPEAFQKLDAPIADFYGVVRRAIEMEKTQQHSAAMGEWKKALELDPEDGEANYNFGLNLMGHGLLDQAIPHFQKATEAIPDFAEAYNNLGFALLQKGKIDEATPDLQKAVDLSPDYFQAQNNLGIALAQRGKVDDAIAHFEKALQIDPKQGQTYYNLGGALYYMQGNVRAGLARWREGLRVDPKNVQLLNQTAWVLATCPEASVRNGPEAVGLAERALKAFGGPDPELLDVLAAAYAEAGRFPEAIQTEEGALHLATQQNAQPLVEELKTRMALYKSKSPFRETQ